MLLGVDTSPGLHGDPEPSAFSLGETTFAVRNIIDRWMGQYHHYFKLEASDGALYILRHDLPSNTWELTLFQAPPRVL